MQQTINNMRGDPPRLEKKTELLLAWEKNSTQQPGRKKIHHEVCPEHGPFTYYLSTNN